MARTNRVLTFSSLEDPSATEVQKLEQLLYLKIVEMMPGVALVELEKADVSKLAADLPLWQVSKLVRLK